MMRFDEGPLAWDDQLEDHEIPGTAPVDDCTRALLVAIFHCEQSIGINAIRVFVLGLDPIPKTIAGGAAHAPSADALERTQPLPPAFTGR